MELLFFFIWMLVMAVLGIKVYFAQRSLRRFQKMIDTQVY